jgi:uncharacterized protein (TIGR02588 family)
VSAGAKASAPAGQGGANADEREERDAPSRGPRRFAEWLTFGISLALVLTVVVFLIWRLREPVTDTPPTQVSLQLDRITERDGRFVLPIEVKNRGARSIRDLQVRVDYREHGERRSMDVLVDYVGQSAEQVLFVYFREDPRSLSVRAEPISYRVE